VNRFALITRHPAECAELQEKLSVCGITLRPYPVLRIADVNDDPAWSELASLSEEALSAGWLVVTSPRAPRRFARLCRERDAPFLLDLPTAAIGPGTAEAAAAAGLEVTLVGPGTGTGLARQLVEKTDCPTTFVLACGRHRRPELPRALAEAGHRVLPVVVYRMDPTPVRELPPLGPSLDAVILTSPRAAELYLQGVGGLPLPCPHWALGPTTQEAAVALGIPCTIPSEPTMDSLAEELCTI
jgi:uroporphyrinogen-III synthase